MSLSDEQIEKLAIENGILYTPKSVLIAFTRAIESAALAVPEGYVLVEKSFIPTEVMNAGRSALDLCKRQGYDDNITVMVIFDSMILASDRALLATGTAIEGDGK